MTPYAVIAGISFVGMIVTGLWPKSCLSQFQRILQDRGEAPNQRFGKEKMKELDPVLYRKWRAGLILSSIFTAAFVFFALMAWMNR